MSDFVCLFSVDCIGTDDKIVTEYGLIPADDFKDAVTQLEDILYGSSLVKINYMELFDTCPTFSESVFTLLKKEFES